MKLRLLAAFPLVLASLFSVVALVAGERGLAAVLTAENETGKIVAAVGCFAAALAFERGDYLRRAWLFSGLCFVLLLFGDLAGQPALAARLGATPLDVTQGTFAVVANAASVVGTWMLARAWSVSGLEDDDDAPSRTRRRLLFAGAALLALAVTAWPLVHDLRALLAGDLGAAVSIASDLGDTICFALVAPVMQTALAMRGGLLRWPWGLLTSSGIAWIVFDAASGVVDALHVSGAHDLVVTEAFRALACGFVLAAGMAQRFVVAPDARLTIPPPPA